MTEVPEDEQCCGNCVHSSPFHPVTGGRMSGEDSYLHCPVHGIFVWDSDKGFGCWKQ